MSDVSEASAPVVQVLHPVFALTPATAVNGIIDYSTAAGRKLYSTATAKVEEDLFDCTADDLYGFLRAVKDRAREFGWDQTGVGILSIPDDPMNPTSFKSLLEQHGEITLQEIYEFEESYIDQPSRSAQDTAQLYRCLMASLSKEGKKKVLVWEDQYTINGLGSGNLLLKIIVRESHLDTNATSTSIRTKLTELDTYLPTIGHDIIKFNTYVKLLVDGLRSRGETITELLTNLFKGYLGCSDRTVNEKPTFYCKIVVKSKNMSWVFCILSIIGVVLTKCVYFGKKRVKVNNSIFCQTKLWRYSQNGCFLTRNNKKLRFVELKCSFCKLHQHFTVKSVFFW